MAMHALDLAPFWLRLVAGFAAGALTWLVSLDYGCALVGRWVKFEHPGSRVGVGAAAGYALIGSLVGLLGLAGAINPWALGLVIVLAIVLRLPHHMRRPPGTTFAQVSGALRASDGIARVALVVIALGACTALVSAALPAVWWDPIAYHLSLAAAALSHHGMGFDPQMVQSGFPQLGEAAALPAYLMAGSAGAAMATLGAGLCIAALVWALGDWVLQGSGPLAAMLAVSCGLWLWLSPSFYVDVPFAMFVVGAMVAIVSPKAGGTTFASAAIAGGLCGAAASVKYTGVPLALVVLVMALYMAGPSWRAGLAGFCGGFFALAAGWYARGFILTGDPVYPFLSGTLARSAQTRDFATRYVEMTRHWCGGGMTLGDLVTLPYRLIADPKHFCGDPGLALQVGVVFALVSLLAVKRARIVALAGVAFTFVWFFSSQQWRFALPAVFLLAALIAAGTTVAGARVRQIGGIVLAVLGAYVIATQWIPALRSEATSTIVPAFGYIRGAESAAQYLDARLESFAAAQWLADRGIAGDRILALDDVRDYYFPAGTSWANPFYQQALVVDWGAPSRVRYALLRARGIIYMVVNRNPAYLARTPTGVDWAALDADEQHGLRKVFSANDVSVYDLSGVR